MLLININNEASAALPQIIMTGSDATLPLLIMTCTDKHHNLIKRILQATKKATRKTSTNPD